MRHREGIVARARVRACVCTPQYMNAVALHPPVTVRRCLAETHANMPPKIIYMKDNPNAARLHVHRQTDRQTDMVRVRDKHKKDRAREGGRHEQAKEGNSTGQHACLVSCNPCPASSE